MKKMLNTVHRMQLNVCMKQLLKSRSGYSEYFKLYAITITKKEENLLGYLAFFILFSPLSIR